MTICDNIHLKKRKVTFLRELSNSICTISVPGLNQNYLLFDKNQKITYKFTEPILALKNSAKCLNREFRLKQNIHPQLPYQNLIIENNA